MRGYFRQSEVKADFSTVSRNYFKDRSHTSSDESNGSPAFTQIPGNIDDHDSVLAMQQQTSGENSGALIVKKILVPLTLDELRQQHRDRTTRVLPFDLQEVVDDRLHHESKRRL